jgi:hypothetical protein
MDQIHFQVNEGGCYPKFKPHLLPAQPPTELGMRAVFGELRLIILMPREESDGAIPPFLLFVFMAR